MAADTRRDLQLGTPVLIGALLIVLYGLAEWDGTVLVVAAAVAAAALAVGALLGFLFGIPRSLTSETAPIGPPEGPINPAAPQYRPNTNLEQVSDWFTKILIGVGIAQAREVVEGVRDVADSLKPALGGDDVAHVFGGALVVYFVIAGFLCAYLFTRLRLQRELEDAAANALSLAASSGNPQTPVAPQTPPPNP